jgi:hypothetical protein
MEQTMMQLSARSRITSSSNSFQPSVHRRKRQAALQNLRQFLLVVGDAAAGAAQGEAGAQNARVAHAGGELLPALEGSDELRLRRLQADPAHGVFEEQTVFGLFDGVDLGADQLHAVFFEHPRFRQFHRQIQRRLAAHRGKQRVGPFAADDLFEIRPGKRLDISLIGKIGVGHDGRRVGIDQNDLVAVGAQGLGGLCAGVVELAGLADDDGAGADDQDAVQVVAPGH